MAGLTEFYCRSNEPNHASQFKWLEYTFKFAYLVLLPKRFFHIICFTFLVSKQKTIFLCFKRKNCIILLQVFLCASKLVFLNYFASRFLFCLSFLLHFAFVSPVFASNGKLFFASISLVSLWKQKNERRERLSMNNLNMLPKYS
jgi:hypothetical protein